MREIKFRAWDKSSNIMRTDITSIRYNLDGSINQIDVFEGVDILFPEKEAILMQYTGLKDKNGVEIYEGDIVQLDAIAGIIDRIGTVDYGEAEFVTKIDDDVDFLSGWKSIEVIGNIYENPELLEGKD